MGIITYLFSSILTKEEVEKAVETNLVMIFFAYILLSYFCLIEFLQLKDKGPISYFIDFYNMLDLF